MGQRGLDPVKGLGQDHGEGRAGLRPCVSPRSRTPGRPFQPHTWAPRGRAAGVGDLAGAVGRGLMKTRGEGSRGPCEDRARAASWVSASARPPGSGSACSAAPCQRGQGGLPRG